MCVCVCVYNNFMFCVLLACSLLCMARPPPPRNPTKGLKDSWFYTKLFQRVSQELDYRIDVCRVTKGAHIEHL